MFDSKSISILNNALNHLEKGFSGLPDFELILNTESLNETLIEVAERLKDNFPYFHPLYAGQMLKPPHPIARLAYMLALWINPNNHALDGGRASSAMEKEAVVNIAAMFGWDKFLGHLTSGGTMANLEALWISKKLHPEKMVVASEQAHYTHNRISEVLKLDFESVPCDYQARMDLEGLERILKTGKVGTVVATLGTTGVGSLDPLPEILELRKKYEFRVHVDSAYGGYFTLVDNLNEYCREVYDAITHVDSIVIDPHKHGLQPYGCGCVLFNDPDVGRFYKHDSPYTYFSSSDLHLGEISLECSRAGASAVALWATQRLYPMNKGGEFASNLAKSRSAALDLYNRLKCDSRFLTILEPDLDIVVWAPKAEKISQISQLSQEMFDLCAEHDLHLAVFNYPTNLLEGLWRNIVVDQNTVTCLRSCLIKPEHQDWMDQIWQIMDKVIDSMIPRSS
ncbi:aminotransferase class I/II-fold pyridoxal phosphate-dependent enzyme [bacterium]|nr:aminotransferase class I/II-fold pyridoxal phosphate-dependent enzyme [bacterium]